jgi:hypothetical protein
MGYYTYFEITIPAKADIDDIIEKLEVISDYSFTKTSENQKTKSFATVDTCKWYDYDSNMTDLSQMFPKILLQVDGEGETSNDIWRKYYMNGKSQSVEVKRVYGKPNMKKLKEKS